MNHSTRLSQTPFRRCNEPGQSRYHTPEACNKYTRGQYDIRRKYMRIFESRETASNHQLKMTARGCGRISLAGITAVLLCACSSLSPDTGGPVQASTTAHASVEGGSPPASTTVAAAAPAEHVAETADKDDRIRKGRSQLARHQAEPALATFTSVLGTEPENIPALNGLGVALDMLGRHDEAQTAYRQVLAIAPGDMIASNNLGHSLTLAGRYAE